MVRAMVLQAIGRGFKPHKEYVWFSFAKQAFVFARSLAQIFGRRLW